MVSENHKLKNVLSNWTGLVVAGVFSVLLTPVMIRHHLGVVAARHVDPGRLFA